MMLIYYKTKKTLISFFVFFFFSSRRRHTRLQGDWSSDVCSSDLLCVLFVFLVHSAEYESWSLPLAIILIAPMCLPFALLGTWLRGMDNNLITQIGFITLIGLAAKNAVLIVEFAKQQQEAGRDRFTAAVEASRLRLRPILMTSFAFILGVLPLARATGPGAEMRQALGTA